MMQMKISAEKWAFLAPETKVMEQNNNCLYNMFYMTGMHCHHTTSTNFIDVVEERVRYSIPYTNADGQHWKIALGLNVIQL